MRASCSCCSRLRRCSRTAGRPIRPMAWPRASKAYSARSRSSFSRARCSVSSSVKIRSPWVLAAACDASNHFADSSALVTACTSTVSVSSRSQTRLAVGTKGRPSSLMNTGRKRFRLKPSAARLISHSDQMPRTESGKPVTRITGSGWPATKRGSSLITARARGSSIVTHSNSGFSSAVRASKQACADSLPSAHFTRHALPPSLPSRRAQPTRW
jgi:hypothetical protein